MDSVTHDGYTFEWEGGEPDIHTQIKVTRPNGHTGVHSLGGLINQSSGELWHVFKKAGYEV